MRKNIIGIAFATMVVAVGLLATTAFVGANNSSDGNHIFEFESSFLNATPAGTPINELDIRTVRISESDLFRKGEGAGGAGVPIGHLAVIVIKTEPAFTDGHVTDAAADFTGMGTLFVTRVNPHALPGIILAITGGTGEFQGASGQCVVTEISRPPLLRLWTCDLGITAPALAGVGGPTSFLSTGSGQPMGGYAVLIGSAAGAFVVSMIGGLYARRRFGKGTD